MKQLRQAENAELLKKIREKANTLSRVKIDRLDYGDTALVNTMLHELNRRLEDLHRLQDAGCSQLLELLDYLTLKGQKNEQDASVQDGCR